MVVGMDERGRIWNLKRRESSWRSRKDRVRIREKKRAWMRGEEVRRVKLELRHKAGRSSANLDSTGQLDRAGGEQKSRSITLFCEASMTSFELCFFHLAWGDLPRD